MITQPVSTPVREDYDGDITLMDYLLVLWRHRFILIGVTLLCGIATFVASWFMEPTYEAVAHLIVNASKLDGGEPAASAATYKALLENQSLALNILQEFGLDKPPYNMDVTEVLSKHVAIEVVPNTNIIAVKFRLPDASLAARVANRYVELAIAQVLRLSGEEAVTTRDLVRSQLDLSRDKMAAADGQLKAFKKNAQVELARQDVDSLLKERARLVELSVDIQGEQARLEKAEQEFARQERVRPERTATDVAEMLRRQNQRQDSDRAAIERSQTSPSHTDAGQNSRTVNDSTRAEGDSGSGEIALRSDAINPFINPVYELLDAQIATSRTKLASLEEQRRELVSHLKLAAPQLSQLTTLYDKETELQRLQADFDVAKQAYIDIAGKYDQVQLQVTAHTAQLQLLDAALTPRHPVSPQPVLNTAIAIAIGFLLTAIGLLLFDLVSKARAGQSVGSAAHAR